MGGFTTATIAATFGRKWACFSKILGLILPQLVLPRKAYRSPPFTPNHFDICMIICVCVCVVCKIPYMVYLVQNE